MDELFNILSSSARIDKSKRRRLTVQQQNHSSKSTIARKVHSRLTVNDEDSDSDEEQNEYDHTASSDTNNYDDHTSTGTSSNTSSNTIKSRDRTGKRDTSESKLRQIHMEQMAAFRRSMNIKIKNSRTQQQTQQHQQQIADPISTFTEITCPDWWKSAVAAAAAAAAAAGVAGTSNSNPQQQQQQQQQQQPNQHFVNIHRSILHNIESGRWMEPTAIQMQVIPSILYDRMDCIACAPTGSGKSGAFILPSLFLSSCPYSVFYNNNNNNNNSSYNNNNNNTTNPRHLPTEDSNSIQKKSKSKSIKSTSTASSQEGEIRVLIIAPSYELASQLHREVERLGTGKPGGITAILLSKSNVVPLLNKTLGGKHGIDVLLSTPLRLCDAIQRGLSLNTVRLIVLDEADRLLDATDGSTTAKNETQDKDEDDDDDDDDDAIVQLKYNDTTNNNMSGSGQTQTFLSQMDMILSQIPVTAIRTLFSATVTTHVRELSELILRNPIDITVTSSSGSAGVAANPDIQQELMFVGREEGKLLAIRQLVARGDLRPPVIIFVQSQERAQALFTELLYDNIHVDVIHAGRSKATRDNAVREFRKGTTWVLICTDLVARGVDFRAVNMVINYDLPLSGVTYIHRIGRTGRAGRKGRAITFFTEIDFDNLRTIANVMKQSGCDVPEWMLQLKKSRPGKKSLRTQQHQKQHQQQQRLPPIDTTPSYDKKKLHKKQQAIKHNQQKKKQNDSK